MKYIALDAGSVSVKFVVLDKEGKEKKPIMGCYGIGVGRTVAAAIEQSHDENGIIFPPAIAPYQSARLPAVVAVSSWAP